VLCVVMALVITRPATPNGRYVASEKFGFEGDWYYEFANGKLSMVVHEPDTNGGTVMVRVDNGVFYRTNGAWVLWPRRGAPRSNSIPILLETSWFGVSLSASNSPREFLRRRWISGSRPRWMLDWLPWGIQ
jgi:hypothetical protein